MEIIGRQLALSQGLKHYYTGKPCKRGHLSQRTSSDRRCVMCHREKENVRQKLNVEQANARKRKYVERHPDRVKDSKKKWVDLNIDQVKLSTRAWRLANPDRSNAITAKRRAAKLQRTPAWANLDKIREFYEQSARLTQTTGVQYVVDHIIPLQGEKVSGLHVHNNLQIITAKENLEKSNKFKIDN